MRYTTIIDISEYPLIYNNHNTRLLYLHLCLKSGFHDDDRDILEISIRNLAYEVGISVSACRNSLRILEQCSFIRMSHSRIEVKKWISERKITKREKVETQKEIAKQNQERQRQMEELDKQRQRDKRIINELYDKGINPFIAFYEQKIKEYQDGDIDALVSLKRNYKQYISSCNAMHHKPIEIHL